MPQISTIDDTNLQGSELRNSKDHTVKHKKQKKSVDGNTDSSFKEIVNILHNPQSNADFLQKGIETLYQNNNKAYNINSLEAPNSSENDAQKLAIPHKQELINYNQSPLSKLMSKSGFASNNGKNVVAQDSGRKVPDELCTSVTKSCADETTSSAPGNCMEEEETTTMTTCKITSDAVPHNITTCCRTVITLVKFTTIETTTLRPVSTKMDEMTFDLTVVPLELERRTQPISDPEFFNFGSMGLYHLVDEKNGTVLSGQAAIDFLKYSAGKNMSQEVINHEQNSS